MKDLDFSGISTEQLERAIQRYSTHGSAAL